jgi:hypothetical protein
MTQYELHNIIKRRCGLWGEYLHIKPTPMTINGKEVMVEYITPSWFTDEVFINYQTDRVSSKHMTEVEMKNLASICA